MTAATLAAFSPFRQEWLLAAGWECKLEGKGCWLCAYDEYAPVHVMVLLDIL
jgi:hypothetical protein